ncbi:MAG: hypothetical protein AAF135_21185, partial [Bacteroidota bacterium]
MKTIVKKLIPMFITLMCCFHSYVCGAISYPLILSSSPSGKYLLIEEKGKTFIYDPALSRNLIEAPKDAKKILGWKYDTH